MAVNEERVLSFTGELDSGMYKRGSHRLHRILPDGTEEWCCLGAASDYAHRNGLEITRSWVDLPDGSRSEIFDGHDEELLCVKVQEWYGFESDDPSLEGPGEYEGDYQEASQWNDSGDFDGNILDDFSDIAEAFRRTYITRIKL